jgi:hypothetical protein
MGRGLVRLYLALWLIWFSYGVADNYKELATYVGYDRWTMKKAIERSNEKCKIDPDSIACLSISSNEFVSEERVETVASMFTSLMIIAPFFLFLILTALFWLAKWVIEGFRKQT